MSTTFDGPALLLDNVSKSFGEVTAVDGLSFEVSQGTVLALLGPNGAGKTTTIEMCEGFQKPSAGDISVLGCDPVTQGEQVRSRIGIMLQGGGSYNAIKVREMLKLSASYNADPHDPDWLLELVGLQDAANTTYRRLSGGQKQRLSLALSLIGKPELVFLDEPTAGMDAQSRLMVWDLVSRIRDDGTTVVLTTHLMDEAEALADNVIIIDHGKIVAQGTPAELTSGTQQDWLLFNTETTFDVDQARGSSLSVQAVRPLHYRVDGDPSPELIAQLTVEAARQGVQIRELGITHRNLEEVFLDLTGRELRS
ncbi:ABC transporter ATP-binding protein [Corynebacterium breve]|uniref:ABC transporter ATP-binding protein n=1 Tax=Corynebacterium breve TaxID=3049799 RepID=A0ABY8VKY0_9CORY|nr:ABC transporter ATP-binding protein [Corynebacterium breve]WIM68883.1 ABC transporter ATP-binding protein [Corynebacterium breve]